jgi:hypothetical protein
MYVRCSDCAKALTQFEIDHERCECGVKLRLLEDNDAEAAVAKARSGEVVPEECRAGFRELAAKVALYEAERLLTPEQAEKLRELLAEYGRDLLERCESMLAAIGVSRDGGCSAACTEDYGHDDDCPFAALLSDLRKELGKP